MCNRPPGSPTRRLLPGGATAGGKAAGLTEEETVAIRRSTFDGDAKLAALLAVTREAMAEVGRVSDATWQAALGAGWSDVELSELSVHVVVNLFTNHFNHLVGTELDLPAAPEVDSESAA
ncbi:MAG: hypothetical protein H0U62_08165 [Actinobacteria bacterium]|nr:hypothetical protein [Actinomycetota bacterium]